MKTAILLPALGLAALGLAACGPKTESGNTAAETVTLNDDGAVFDNAAGLETDGNSAAGDTALTGNVADNATSPAAGNAL